MHEQAYNWVMGHKAWDSAKPEFAKSFADYYVTHWPGGDKPFGQAWMEFNGWSSKPVPEGKYFGS
jgi:hypothetical protein